MTDAFLHNKIHEVFDSVIKKTNIIDKIIELKKINSSFIFFSTITGTILILNSLYINYTLNIKYCNLKNKIAEIDIIHNKINNIILLIKENRNLIQSNLYNNSFNLGELINQTSNQENEEENKVKRHIDDELLSECYDNIPCNNIKKVIGINRLFGW